VIDPASATARAVIGALNAAPIVLGDAAALFGGRVTGDFKRQFDARVADAILIKAGIANPADRPRSCHGTAPRDQRGLRVTMIALIVNGRAVNASAEPRTHLADFLRDSLNLTGTHLGCEHGVCGACTLLLDDMPARSCIIYAVACDRARVTTIEGLDDDEIATELRAAFRREHALQCGYCTPGMLVSARDLVLRLPVSDERSVRVGLSGNLCRCTGYVGIVRAVRSVIDERRKRGIRPVPGGGRSALGPVGSGNGSNPTSNAPTVPIATAELYHQDSGAIVIPHFTPEKVFKDHFTIDCPPDAVFDMFGDVARVAACLPGASLTGVPTRERAEGLIRVKLGPVSANFHGAAHIERNPKICRAGSLAQAAISAAGLPRRARSSTNSYRSSKALRRVSNFRSAII